MAMNMDYSQIMKLAQSEAGQKLLAMIQKASQAELNQAIQKANNGDYEGAKQALSGFLSNPEAQKLLKQLGG